MEQKKNPLLMNEDQQLSAEKSIAQSINEEWLKNQELIRLNRERSEHDQEPNSQNKDHNREDQEPNPQNKYHNREDQEPNPQNKYHNRKDQEPNPQNKDHNREPNTQNKDHNREPNTQNKDHIIAKSTRTPGLRPFAHLRLAPSDFLDDTASSSRSPCSGCGRSRRFYCPMCCVPVPGGQPLPVVRLPFAVRILKHPAEYHGKSTSPHAAILSPDCRLVRYPLLPELKDPSTTVVVFPAAEGAISVEELAKRIAGEGVEAEARQTALEERMSKWTVLFVDSTWRQANAIVNDDRLRGITRVALSNHSSRYWRYEEGLTSSHLSTIEAVYYLCADLHSALVRLGYYQDSGAGELYDGRYDNLLFYFNHLYALLYDCYDGGRACDVRKRRHFQLDRGAD